MYKMFALFMSFFNKIFCNNCAICMESTFLKNKHTLSCGHTFHTHCIMQWFRTKKNTCPYCRNTGQHVTLSESNQHLIIDGWESHEAVQEYHSSSNPTKEQIIEAYYIRDINMGLDIDYCFNSCVRGMGVDPDKFEENIKFEFIRENERKFKEFMNNLISNSDYNSTFETTLNFNKYMLEKLDSEKYKDCLKMYHEMEDAKNNNDHKGIYNLISVNNLRAMGW